jgi:hypothetical protein
MQTQILKVAMIAAMLACAVGIAAFARGAYDYTPPVPAPGARGAPTYPG